MDLYDPVFISMVREAMPGLIAEDLCNIQPMNAETATIFSLKTTYKPGPSVPYTYAIDHGYCMDLWYEDFLKWVTYDRNKNSPKN